MFQIITNKWEPTETKILILKEEKDIFFVVHA